MFCISPLSTERARGGSQEPLQLQNHNLWPRCHQDIFDRQARRLQRGQGEGGERLIETIVLGEANVLQLLHPPIDGNADWKQGITMLCPFAGRDQRSSWKEEHTCPLSASGLQTASGQAACVGSQGRGMQTGCFQKGKGWWREEKGSVWSSTWLLWP